MQLTKKLLVFTRGATKLYTLSLETIHMKSTTITFPYSKALEIGQLMQNLRSLRTSLQREIRDELATSNRYHSFTSELCTRYAYKRNRKPFSSKPAHFLFTRISGLPQFILNQTLHDPAYQSREPTSTNLSNARHTQYTSTMNMRAGKEGTLSCFLHLLFPLQSAHAKSNRGASGRGKGAIIRLTLSLQSQRGKKEVEFFIEIDCCVAREYYAITYKGIPLLPSYITFTPSL